MHVTGKRQYPYHGLALLGPIWTDCKALYPGLIPVAASKASNLRPSCVPVSARLPPNAGSSTLVI